VLDSIQRLRGEISVGNDAKAVLDRIYKEFKDVDDYRFKHYSTRRFTHLLKLCMVFAVSDLRMEISAHDALRANTLLHYTEQRMPKALGEFGRSKYSEIANIILEGLERAHGVVGMNELWKWVHKDLAKQTELHEIVRNLLLANKIQVLTVKGKQGYAPKKEVTEKWSDSLLLPDYLTPEEMVG
jgi:hypothetical protein